MARIGTGCVEYKLTRSRGGRGVRKTIGEIEDLLIHLGTTKLKGGLDSIVNLYALFSPPPRPPRLRVNEVRP